MNSNGNNWEFVDTEETLNMSSCKNRLVGVIDASTDSITFAIFTTPEFEQIVSYTKSLNIQSSQDGWYEQNPIEIINLIKNCAHNAITKLDALNYNITDIASIGITNQRETIILWDKYTGKPLYNAIVWNDIRAATIVDQIQAKLPDHNKNYFKNTSGLPMHPYFSAFKIKWLKNNILDIRKACKENRCLAGTVDSWIIWNLTGGVNGGIHITDVTNASRTFLMNIDTLNWDPLLLQTFNINLNMLPEIRSSAEIYGKVNNDSVLNGLFISAILGNQQAALLGHSCIKPGQTKCTYHSGCFLLCNTGQKVISEHGLITTVAYKLGKNSPTIYALEGSVAVAGAALKWLKNNFGILDNTQDAEKLASLVNTTGDVYFVPAFTGLYAPYWRKDARGVICGLTQFTTKNHIIRAALESICYQNRDILECMNQEHGYQMTKLYTDGLLTSNNLLMQLQADLLGIPIFSAKLENKAALGVALAAAQADGINACVAINEKIFNINNSSTTTYLPTTTEEERDSRYASWKKAIHRSLGWIKTEQNKTMTTERLSMLASIPAGIVLMSIFGLLIIATKRMKS